MYIVSSIKDTIYACMGWSQANDAEMRSRIDILTARVGNVATITLKVGVTLVLSLSNIAPFFLAFPVGWVWNERIQQESEVIAALWKKHMVAITVAAIALGFGGTVFTVIYLPYVLATCSSAWAAYLGSQAKTYGLSLLRIPSEDPPATAVAPS